MRFSDSFIQDLRDRVPISEVVGTRVSWDKAKTNISRRDFWGCCPFHGEKSPSFHCEDNKGRYHCFGCGASGDHFRFYMELDGVSFPLAIEMVATMAGINLPNASGETEAERREREARQQERLQQDEKRQREQERQRRRKAETAASIWREGLPIAGTPAEKYLQSRSIDLSDFPEGTEWMPSLRYHPNMLLERVRHPALIGGVQSKDRRLTAVWRIFLNPDGTALVGEDGRKIKLGLGPASGGAVRLGPVTSTLKLTEGIETGLGVALLTRMRTSVWAALSTTGIINFEIPDGVQRLEIYADGDRHRINERTREVMEPPGISAAKKLQERAQSIGVEAVIYPSPEPDDWLDVWVERKKDEQQQRAVQYL